jgi:hypothetical protein
MYGNRLGWLISAGMLLAMIGLLALLSTAANPSEPTKFGREGGKLVAKLPTDPRALLKTMTETGDAGDLYLEAIKAVKLDEVRYRALAQTPPSSVPTEKLTAVDLLCQAATIDKATIFVRNPSQVITYDPEPKNLMQLQEAADAAINLGLCQQAAKHPDEAKRDYEAAFALGIHLYEERLTYKEYDLGMNLMGQAGTMLADLANKAGDTARAKSLNEFLDSRNSFYGQQIEPPARVIVKIAPPTGDMLVLVDNAGDPMWKIEAILALGRCKYNASTFGDQKTASRTVRRLSESPDRLTAAAASAARDLTREGFQGIVR